MADRNWRVVGDNLKIYVNNVLGMTISAAGVISGTFSGAALSATTPRIIASSGVSASHTGNTSETQLASIAIPANTLGANGALRVTTTWTGTASANNKIYRVRFNGSGGSGYMVATVTNVPSNSYITIIQNKNSTSSQGGSSVGGGGSSSAVTSAVDTTAATAVSLTGTLANSGETITLVSYTVEFIPGV